MQLTNNGNADKNKYSGCDIGFDYRLEFSFTDWSMGENVIIFGTDLNSSVDIDNPNKDFLILDKGPTQR